MKTIYRMNGFFYLNNSGSRWIIVEDNQKIKIDVLFPDGHIEKRTCLYFESFGNFAVTCISLSGKKRTFFQDSTFLPDGSEFKGIILKESDIPIPLSIEKLLK